MKPSFNFKSIRTKLIINLISICLVPLLILGIATYFQSKSILSKKLEVTSKQTLTEIDNGLNNYFAATSAPIKMLSTNINFTEADIGERLNYAELLLGDVKESNPNILNTFYGTESGKFAAYPKLELPKDFNHKNRPWYTLALEKKGQIAITRPYKDAQTGKLVVSLSKAVEKDGKVVGVVGIDMSLDTLSNTLSKSKIGDSGYVFICDNNGTVISHPKKEEIGGNTPTKLSFWNDLKNNKSGFTKYDYQGQNKFSTYETNTVTGWKMVASMNEDELNKDLNSVRSLILIVALIVAVIAIFIATLISKGIANNLNKIKHAFNLASNGDLTAKADIKSKDEFGELGKDFNIMIDNISNLMKNVESSSKTVLETSSTLATMAEETTYSVGQVSHAIEEIASGATHTAQSAQEGAEDIQNLSEGLDKIEISTEKMEEVSASTRQLGSQGLEIVQVLVEKSDKTKLAALQVSDIVKEMNSSTDQIDAISGKISDITEQTNLLSLNASIEAARAGEAGRGFAVVADEIRKLAEQSKNSTEEIKKIIEDIKSKSTTAVRAIDETETVVKDQEEAVVKTQKIFREIISSIGVLTEKVDEIKNQTMDINNKKEKVVGQIENISAISEETASATEEVSASTEEINAIMDEFTRYAEQLKDLSAELEIEIGKFKL
ncbi:methyl-accepting chemotaxis protein [Clostridium sp. OS1-26]|uniref:methyl-accepting chemotaxis protein n=1 Tax=Clostridium sp. OS1-26 TaxID=3070681 RepID=UPI0027E20FFC|nr:methyl-accepting chemotaxis protein [Clostridium sp. OS1-26]WML35543.1 methyl-accepting chemotaxis protein [Clostridium sp. OS1-26]